MIGCLPSFINWCERSDGHSSSRVTTCLGFKISGAIFLGFKISCSDAYQASLIGVNDQMEIRLHKLPLVWVLISGAIFGGFQNFMTGCLSSFLNWCKRSDGHSSSRVTSCLGFKIPGDNRRSVSLCKPEQHLSRRCLYT